MSAKQVQCYKAVQKATMTGREIEASALTQAAVMLKQCRDNWDAPDREGVLHEALRLNQMIWSIFQVELTQDANPLPKKLREDILSLSIFIDRKIIDVMGFPSPDKLTPIIDINLNLAAGLRGAP